MISIKGLDHIGIAVNSIEESLTNWKDILGMKLISTEEISEQKVQVAVLLAGNIKIELLQPTCPDSPVSKFIEKNGEGVQHIAMEVEDIEFALQTLSDSNIRLIDQTPRNGVHDSKIAFINPKCLNKVLLELCEKK